MGQGQIPAFGLTPPYHLGQHAVTASDGQHQSQISSDAFSEKLEVEGRSLLHNARRRFVHNRAALISLLVIALFVLFAPMLAKFRYDDTDWAMMSSPPDTTSGRGC